MDENRFYGRQNTVIMVIPVDSGEEVASGSNSQENVTILAVETIFDSKTNTNYKIENSIVIPETDFGGSHSEDSIPLSELSNRLPKRKKQKTNHSIWNVANLVVSDKNITFLGSGELPRELKELHSPYRFSLMSCNRWEEIKHFLHFNNNDNCVNRNNEGCNKLFETRPLLTKIRERLLTVSTEEYLAVDEQIIPTKARSTLKQYSPKNLTMGLQSLCSQW
ncbi:hypothetical protein ILUMI_18556, partial [Ignelater luminosus]